MGRLDSAMDVRRHDPERSASVGTREWLAVAGIGCGVFMSTLDAGIVNVTLPTLVEELQASFGAVQWVVISYLLIMTSLMLGVARLGDMHGKKGIYLGGVVVFAAASLLCGLAPAIEWLIAFRALQGVGAVMMAAFGPGYGTGGEHGRAVGRARGDGSRAWSAVCSGSMLMVSCPG